MKQLKILAALTLAATAAPASAASLAVGQPAPNFDLKLIGGKHVHLSDLRGQVVVLNYWATWCVPCRTELPLLDSYYRAATKRGWPLKIYAVATQDSVPAYQMKPLFAALAIPSASRIHGGPFANVDGLPTNYVIDKAGVLRYAKSGAFELGDLNQILIPLLREPAPAQ
ncbi:MAG TPA: TlpA disulfide reductase family protein [Sphingomicrobium sp.]|nr:TlpA disulfide reductase family protein [Sphingomicrobium sp.]